MIERPTTTEVEALVSTIENYRTTWRGNPGYLRQLDVELHALKLLLIVTRIEDEEITIAGRLRNGGTGDG